MNMNKQITTDIVLGTIIIYVVFWKFGDLLFNPSVLWTSPLSILYLNGSDKSTIIAIVFSVLYFIYKIKKHKISLYPTLDLLPFGFLPFFLVYNMAVPLYGYKTSLPWGISISNSEIKYQPINYYLVITIICLVIFLSRKKSVVNTGFFFSRTVMILGASNLLFTFLAPVDLNIIGLSYRQLISIILVLIGIVANKNEPIKG